LLAACLLFLIGVGPLMPRRPFAPIPEARHDLDLCEFPRFRTASSDRRSFCFVFLLLDFWPLGPTSRGAAAQERAAALD
jgi:hypothetical protein